MKRDLLSKLMIFSAGAGIGSLVTWKLVKTKYEQIAERDIESVREMYAKHYDTEGVPEGDTEEEEPDAGIVDDLQEDKDTYNDIIEEAGYAAESVEETEKEVEPDMDKPYVIAPYEFGETDYAMVTLHYYTDGVVTNDKNKMIANVDELIGEESLTHFGDYEEDPDTVYVRNDKFEIDYEILMDYRPYSEIDE